MPSRSPQQRKFMRAIAKNKKFAKKVGVSQSVGAKFMKADKKKKKRVRKYQFGGLARTPERDPTAAMLGQGLGSMGAVEGATDVGLGARGARPRPKTPPMGFSPRSSLPVIGPEGSARRRPTEEELEADRIRRRRRGQGKRPMGFTAEEIKSKRGKKKGGTVKSYYHGGKIRGCGKETQGRRKAKMIRMKGS